MDLLAEHALTTENAVHHVDLLTLCNALPSGSVDMILCDLPYGTTACSWDTVIPFAPMWAQFKRVIKPRGAIVLTASQPFTSALVMSNPKIFRHEWIWNKELAGNFLLAKTQPLKIHESALVFAIETPAYYPQMRRGYRRTKGGGRSNLWAQDLTTSVSDQYYPQSVLSFPNTDRINTLHPTQKPVALFRYLIRTYTQPGELVLDPCSGSGTTAIAAREEGRRFICGDTSAAYVAVARKRLAAPFTLPLFAA